MEMWPHQEYGITETLRLLGLGHKRVCLTSPTGGGKTRILAELAKNFLEAGRNVVLYTNRKILVEQTSAVLAAAGLDHGVRAAGYADDRHMDFQVSSLQTENSRVLKSKKWELHEAELVLVDEAHSQKGAVARAVLDKHVEELGGAVVGLTATPLGIGEIYEDLIVAGTMSSLRKCGAVVPCRHYGPDEPDLSKIGKVRLGEDLSEKQNVKAMMVPGIFGRVYDWWRKLNPDGLPTILFAPGVGESLWFAEQFTARGVPAVHIDGEDVWARGEFSRASKDARRQVLEESQKGEARVLCNRFVLREGVDAPWLRHGIFATVFGSLQSYLQSGGRLLRAYPGCEGVTLQDHGGNWWRHGSLNADRLWELGQTNETLAAMRGDGFRNKKPGDEPEPFRCPRCGMILARLTCTCGYDVRGGTRSRPVIQADGSAKEYEGDVFKTRRVSTKPNAAKIWERVYYRAKASNMTFRQAEALFAYENNWGYPPRDLPLMPLKDADWVRKVGDVKREELTQ